MDGKTFIATLIIGGFIVLTGIGYFFEIPPGNVKTVDGNMVALGAAVGAAVMAILRTNSADEKRVDNTGKALDAIKETGRAATATAQAAGIPGTDHPIDVTVVNPAHDPANVTVTEAETTKKGK